MLGKDRLIFDPADLTESDQIGAYLRAGSDGDLITSTLTGSKESLDVNVVGTADGGYFAEDSTHSSGAIGQFILAIQTDSQGPLANDGDYVGLQVDSQGRLRCITDIDLVGDLVGDNESDTEDPLKIGSRAVSGVLSAATNGNKVNVISDLYRRIMVNVAPRIGSLATALTVGTTAVALPSSALAGRMRVVIQNLSNSDIYIGGSGVTTSSGVRVGKGATYSEDIGQDCVLYAIAGTSGNDVRVLELA
jgi:hypothetical protein